MKGRGKGCRRGKEKEKEKQKEEEGEQMMARNDQRKREETLSHNLSGPIPGNRILLHQASVPGQD